MSEQKPIIGISIGDLNGIGMEVIMKTFLSQEMLSFCTPVVFGSSKTASFHRKVLKMDKFSFNIVHDISKINPNKPNLINSWNEDLVLNLGKEDKEVGKFAYKSLQVACDHLEAGSIDALVTAPINKSSIQSEQFSFAGHTDYLEDRFKSKATMMLVGEDMKMALATVHIPISEVSTSITSELLGKRLSSISKTLKNDFNIRKGRIAVLGLNPHAGDNGVIGKEDDELIKPAIAEAFENGIMAFGPYSADSFFGSGNFKKFDAILSMYHDQGLIPFKSMTFGSGINYSSGLPIVRTSPDHGTGFDIAGKGEANESSFREAVLLACDIVKVRTENLELEKKAIKKQRKDSH